MRRAVAVVAAAGWIGTGLFWLASATQNRPDYVRSGTASKLVLSVRSKRIEPAVAAAGLVASCRPTIGRSALSGPTALGGDRYEIVVRPALGIHATRRFLGCLEDATLDRVSARVVARRDRNDGHAQPPSVSGNRRPARLANSRQSSLAIRRAPDVAPGDAATVLSPRSFNPGASSPAPRHAWP